MGMQNLKSKEQRYSMSKSDVLFSEGQNTGQYNNQYGNYDKIQGVRNEVNEAKQVTAQNIERLQDRNERLDNLQNRSADLEQGAAEFQSRARSLKRKYWWRNMKMWMILGVVLLFVLIIWIISAKTGKVDPIEHDSEADVVPGVKAPP